MANRTVHILLTLFFLLTLVPSTARAQWNFDVLTVEALITDHKNIRSVLLARSALEQANKVLHNYSMEASVGYDSLNVQLDKYTKCFEIIDIIYNSGKTVLNVYNTSSEVTRCIGELEQLIEKFSSQCLLRGNIEPTDTMIINACRNCVTQVIKDGKSLVQSLIELSLYITGREMTTKQLLAVIGNINESLDNIREGVDHTYYFVWKYVTIRTHYYKRKTLPNGKPIKVMCDDAISRWKAVAKQVAH